MQGDPLAMCMYALSLQPLISRLQAVNQGKQCWFADDATGCGSLQNIRVWWNELMVTGPDLRYYLKCWLVKKPDKEETTRSNFEETAINIDIEEQRHLGVAWGSRIYLEQYVNGKVKEWVGQVTKLVGVYCVTTPGLLHSVYIFGLKYCWTYFPRTLDLPDIEDLLAPLECAIAGALILSTTGQNCTQAECALAAGCQMSNVFLPPL